MAKLSRRRSATRQSHISFTDGIIPQYLIDGLDALSPLCVGVQALAALAAFEMQNRLKAGLQQTPIFTHVPCSVFSRFYTWLFSRALSFN